MGQKKEPVDVKFKSPFGNSNEEIPKRGSKWSPRITNIFFWGGGGRGGSYRPTLQSFAPESQTDKISVSHIFGGGGGGGGA